MISPADNSQALRITAKLTGVNHNILGPSRLAQKCLALVLADRYLHAADVRPISEGVIMPKTMPRI